MKSTGGRVRPLLVPVVLLAVFRRGVVRGLVLTGWCCSYVGGHERPAQERRSGVRITLMERA